MKFIYALSACALFLTVGCNNQPEAEQVEVVEKATETETVKVVQVEAPVEKVVVEKEKGTTIKIGPDGGSLETKKVDIKINN
ncbi:hypothetical protein [Pontibacter akesuensis]|uniref:Uncharacterized protein n=1 Tax=Pontibacter akesuensis TaxID=388950 RepID=A0A1I7K9A9_9BACT|nr:hypothetical protein [Pontibacter akesuensis]GHA74075.1 hypothetical protein GCM10007389_29630 [Pontibacter akesuensis]SFU93980.1 hypothetical protein SAMN04487941_3545 [Pontibacter akesuensis]